MTDTIDFIKDDEQVTVENMTNIQVGYILPSSGVIRRFLPKVKATVNAGELRELSYQNGGLDLLQKDLRVNNRQLAAEFGVDDDVYDHEYSWTTKEVDACLNDPDINVLLDALDFAPEGIVESLKNRAVELEIADTNKLKAIGEKTHCDLAAIIKNKHAYDDANEEKAETKAKTRRVSNKKTSSTTRRRTTTTATK